MKNSNEVIEERLRKILVLIQEMKQATPLRLSNELNVSISTIRRDLIVLEKKNEIIKHHGFCTYNFKNTIDFDETGPERIKELIGITAAEFIKNNDTVFVNTSSTALNAIKFSKSSNLTIISNNLKLAYLKTNPHSSYILTGGELRVPKESLVGDIALNTINETNADICIIGCSGIDLENGVTTKIMNEAKINKAMIEKTTQLKILVADHRKIGITSKFKISDLNKFDYLITDEYSPKKVLDHYSKLGIKILKTPSIS